MFTGLIGNILGLFIIVAVFYFVLRMVRKGGCCGHSEDEHDQHDSHSCCGTGISKKE